MRTRSLSTSVGSMTRGHCTPSAAMHPEIAEASENLNRRYVVNAPHRRAKWIGRAIRAEPTKPLAVKRPGIWAGSIRAGEMQRDTSRVLDRWAA
jgi:hypothetical protein